MRRPNSPALLPTLLFLASCTSSAPKTSTTPPTPQASAQGSQSASDAPRTDLPIPMVAFQLADSASGLIKVQVMADGSIVSATGEAWGKLDGTTITVDGSTEPMWSVDAEGKVSSSVFGGIGIRFSVEDALLVEGPRGTATASIDDAGLVLFDDHKGQSESPWKVIGMSPRARRAALLLSMSIPRTP